MRASCAVLFERANKPPNTNLHPITAEDYVPRLMTPFRRIVLPDQPSLTAVAALQHRSQPKVSSNIQPFRRAAPWRRQALRQLNRQQPTNANNLRSPAAEVAATQKQSAAVAQPWYSRLLGGLAAVAATVRRLAASPLRVARTYQPFGHEVGHSVPMGNAPKRK